MKRILCLFRDHRWGSWKPSWLEPFKIRECKCCNKMEVDPPLSDEFVMACVECLEEIEAKNRRSGKGLGIKRS
jgi:hypothetical protein